MTYAPAIEPIPWRWVIHPEGRPGEVLEICATEEEARRKCGEQNARQALGGQMNLIPRDSLF